MIEEGVRECLHLHARLDGLARDTPGDPAFKANAVGLDAHVHQPVRVLVVSGLWIEDGDPLHSIRVDHLLAVNVDELAQLQGVGAPTEGR